jgi:hypothetical protein
VIFRLYPTKDTFVTNDFRYPNYTRLTASNVGASEELDVFKRAGISGAEGDIGSSSLGRILMQFDLTQYTSLTGSGELAGSGVTFHLRMNHKTGGCTRPSSFDLIVRPVSSSWDEGLGQDVGRLADEGFSNWDRRTSADFWTIPGGDFLASPTASFHFDTGVEDMEVDVTSIVNGWLSGTYPNNGLGIALTASLESNSVYVDYYQKKFYSRHTQFEDRGPYLEVRFNDVVRDDRANVQWGRSGTLYLYNAPGGAFQDLPGNFITVAISDASGVLTYLTASRGAAPGIYSASFALPTGSYSAGRPYSGSLFHDSWGSGSFAFATGSFVPVTLTPTNSMTQYPLTARVRNMQDEYVPEDVAVLEVLFRRRPHTLPVVQTASLGVTPYIVEQAYYAVENESTRERVIPFGTGSQQHTRLSYGEGGNSFRLYMRNLHAGNAYRILFLVLENGRQQIIDGGFRFKVV